MCDKDNVLNTAVSYVRFGWMYNVNMNCTILSCDIPVVLDTIRRYRIVQSKHN